MVPYSIDFSDAVMEFSAKSDVPATKNAFSTMMAGDATEVVNMTDAKENLQTYAPMCPVIDLARRQFNADLLAANGYELRITAIFCVVLSSEGQESE